MSANCRIAFDVCSWGRYGLTLLGRQRTYIGQRARDRDPGMKRTTIIPSSVLAFLAFAGIAHADETCGDVLSGQLYDCTTTFTDESTQHLCVEYDEAEGLIAGITAAADVNVGPVVISVNLECGCTIEKPEEEFMCVVDIIQISEIGSFHAELDVNGDYSNHGFTSGGQASETVCEQVTSCTP